jgi:hypothetical protein
MEAVQSELDVLRGILLKANALDLNTEALVTWLQDGISGAKPQLSDKERAETLMAFEQDLQKKETEQLKQLCGLRARVPLR